MGDKALKQQLALLQEQKKKRLIKRNELKSSESKKNKDSPDSSTNSPPLADSLQEDDEDLGLQLHGGNRSNNFQETDDYKDLQETIRELRDENGRLDKLLGEKEEGRDMLYKPINYR